MEIPEVIINCQIDVLIEITESKTSKERQEIYRENKTCKRPNIIPEGKRKRMGKKKYLKK